MTSPSRLKHAAAGLLGSLISRNSDVDGYWAPGLLYRDAGTPPHTMQVDLLTQAAQPVSGAATRMAACYAAILRAAPQKKGIGWEALTRATILFQFNAYVFTSPMASPCAGDPFICTDTLQVGQGRPVFASTTACCFTYRRGAFARSARPGSHMPQPD